MQEYTVHDLSNTKYKQCIYTKKFFWFVCTSVCVIYYLNNVKIIEKHKHKLEGSFYSILYVWVCNKVRLSSCVVSCNKI